MGFTNIMTKNAWMLPDQISDVLPRQAATLEALRRGLLDGFGDVDAQ